MSVSISEFRIDYADWRPIAAPTLDDPGDGIPGSLVVSRMGVRIEAPHHWKTVTAPTVPVRPEDIDALIAALQQAEVLGRQIFNSGDES